MSEPARIWWEREQDEFREMARHWVSTTATWLDVIRLPRIDRPGTVRHDAKRAAGEILQACYAWSPYDGDVPGELAAIVLQAAHEQVEAELAFDEGTVVVPAKRGAA